MKIIAVEEHFALPPTPGTPKGLPPLEAGTMLGAPWLENPAAATDLGEKRIAVLGADRVMFSADYPFAAFEGSEKILQSPNVSPENREKFAHGNAERLLGLKM